MDYIRYTIDEITYELINNGDGTWSKSLDAPDVAGVYDLLLEIGENGLVTYIDSSDPRYSFYLEVIDEIKREVNLIKYLPEFLQEIDEYNKVFNPENYELDLVYNEINTLMLNTFIRTANAEKITEIEKFLRIKGIGTLEQRRSYLLALFQRGKKMNENTIKEVANTITGSDCIVTFFSANQSDNPKSGVGLLRVQVLSPDNNKDYRYDDIFRSLKLMVPSHIELLVIKYFAMWKDVGENFYSWETVKALSNWENLKNYIPPQ